MSDGSPGNVKLLRPQQPAPSMLDQYLQNTSGQDEMRFIHWDKFQGTWNSLMEKQRILKVHCPEPNFELGEEIKKGIC